MASKDKPGDGSRRIERNRGATSDAEKPKAPEESGTEGLAWAPMEPRERIEAIPVRPLEAQAAEGPAVDDPSAIENAAAEGKRGERERAATPPDVNSPTPNGQPEEPDTMNFEYDNEAIFRDAPQASGALNADEASSTSSCDPCSDLITAAKRVIRDPKVTKNVGDLLLGVAEKN